MYRKIIRTRQTEFTALKRVLISALIISLSFVHLKALAMRFHQRISEIGTKSTEYEAVNWLIVKSGYLC